MVPRRLREYLLIIVSLAPAVGLVGVLFGASVVYGVAQSLASLPFIGEEQLKLNAYRRLLTSDSITSYEFWTSLLFSLWVSGSATILAAVGALGLITLVAPHRNATPHPPRFTIFLALNLAFPHLVWAIGLLLLLSQSGLLSRIATSLNLISAPAEFPILVRDPYGIGIIIAYVTKGLPFLTLILLAIVRSHGPTYQIVAETLGATPWQRLRYVTIPLVMPGLVAGSLLLFAFVLSAYEVPALLGVSFPRMLAVLARDFFLNPDLHHRAEGMAIGVIMALIVLGIVASLRHKL